MFLSEAKSVPKNNSLNYHFVTSNTLSFLIAENRLFQSKGVAGRKGRIFKTFIRSYSNR